MTETVKPQIFAHHWQSSKESRQKEQTPSKRTLLMTTWEFGPKPRCLPPPRLVLEICAEPLGLYSTYLNETRKYLLADSESRLYNFPW